MDGIDRYESLVSKQALSMLLLERLSESVGLSVSDKQARVIPKEPSTCYVNALHLLRINNFMWL